MRKIIETIEEYDNNGKLTRKTITETTEDGDAEKIYVPWLDYPYTPINPYLPQITYSTISTAKNTEQTTRLT